MAKVVIFGVGQIAEIAHFYLTHDSEHEVVAFTVDREFLKEAQFAGLPVVPFEEVRALYPPEQYKMLVPISYRKVNQLRAEKYQQAKQKGYAFITYISSKAVYYGTPVGENCFIFESNVIQPFTKIGDNCILWSGNHIGHHSVIENHCFIASHVVISGKVVVGEYTFIGVNATVADNLTIGASNVIGANAVIMKSTEPKAVFPVAQTEQSAVPSDKLRRF